MNRPGCLKLHSQPHSDLEFIYVTTQVLTLYPRRRAEVNGCCVIDKQKPMQFWGVICGSPHAEFLRGGCSKDTTAADFSIRRLLLGDGPAASNPTKRWRTFTVRLVRLHQSAFLHNVRLKVKNQESCPRYHV